MQEDIPVGQNGEVMLKGIIRGNIVSTRKQDSLVGSKFMEVEIIENGNLTGNYVIAIDSVGAGIGETVLITTGSSARLALHNTSCPADAVIVGIVD
jgi:ethanolamine utilization protein EutN